MKKSIFLLVIILAVVLSGCGKKIAMDEVAKDGKYHYQNSDLGFTLALPSDFIYYQTQRKEKEGVIDLEILVPTKDSKYPTEVPAYANAVTVKIIPESKWENEKQNNLVEVGRKKDKIYALKFWITVPTDWVDKWNEDAEKKITEDFKL